MTAVKVLVTGANGQVGWELQRTVPDGAMLVALDRAQLDITSAASIAAALDQHRPDVVINAAAYTAVDKAEQEPELATAVNVEGPRLLAEAAAARGASLIHVSTDFVFDGTASTPYAPDAATNPLGVYGKTKLEGEAAILRFRRSNLQIASESANASLIVRTSWVYSAHGNNFVKTMLRLMKERDELRVVADQVGTPTWAHGLAQVLWRFAIWRSLPQKADSLPQRADSLPQRADSLPEHSRPIFHWSDAGAASWYDFAVAIQEEAIALGLLDRAIAVHPITTADYPTPARRPAYSVLDKTTTWNLLRVTPVHWRVALRSMLCELC